jgi:hypothetical protein
MTHMLPTPVNVHPVYASYEQSPYVATFHELSTDLDGSHCFREKGLPTQSTTHRLTNPWVRTQFLSQANQWSSRFKPSFCRWQDTRLTEPISPACDQYIQYLLTSTNSSVLNWYKREIPHRILRIAKALSPPFPSECSTGPARSPFYPTLISNNSECINLLSTCDLSTTRHLPTPIYTPSQF